MSLTTHSLPGFAVDLNGGLLVLLGGSDGGLNGEVVLVLGGGVVGINCSGGVGLGFGGLTLDPEAAGDNSFTNLLFFNVKLLLPSNLITSWPGFHNNASFVPLGRVSVSPDLVMQSWSILLYDLSDVSALLFE